MRYEVEHVSDLAQPSLHVGSIRKHAINKKHLLIITTLDTKGREAAFIKDVTIKLGVHPILMDIGSFSTSQIEPDVTNKDLAGAVNVDLDKAAGAWDKRRISYAIREGGAIIANRLFAEGKLHAVLAIGGGSGTGMGTYIMRSLPFGLPKVMLSTVASRDVREYVQTKDIVMFHSVGDLIGLNDFMRHLLAQAAHAVCGMMNREQPEKSIPMIGVTACGPTSPCVLQLEEPLKQRGYEMMAFHAVGTGGMALEELIGEGRIEGVLDITTRELVDEFYGGFSKGAGPDRLETAGKMGVPLVFAPGGLDFSGWDSSCPAPKEILSRPTVQYDYRYLIRTDAEDMRKVALIIGEKLNKAPDSNYVLTPNKGFSEYSKKGGPFYDHEVDQVFIDVLKGVLNPTIPFEEIDVDINDPVFVKRSVEVLGMLMKKKADTSRMAQVVNA